jgi:hypothetical protein
MGSLKNKCNSKEREKGILKVIARQRRGTFFVKEVLCKCASYPCHGFSVIAKVVDTADKFLTGIAADNDTSDKFIACVKNKVAMEVGSCQG